jgi:trk system potassium uptake protein TrkA
VHIVIMGCGRVGSSLAGTLDSQGHSVAIIDQDAGSFRRLTPTYEGTMVTGVGFDPEVLTEARIQQATAFAAVSSGDNSNILAARVARERFGVENVVARIYDPRRAEVYQRLGIPTVATVRWTTDRIMRRLLPGGTQTEWTDPSGTVSLIEAHYDPGWVGQRVSRIEHEASTRVAFLTRIGEGLLPGPETLVQEGDLVHLMVREEDRAQVEAFLEAAPPPEEH